MEEYPVAVYLTLLSPVLSATVISQVALQKVLGPMNHIPIYQVTKDVSYSSVCMRTK